MKNKNKEMTDSYYLGARIRYIEYLRVLCMLWVILNHTCLVAIGIFPEFQVEGRELLPICWHSISTISHFAVPIFFMITGSLLLDYERDLSLSKISKYVQKYALVILIFGWGFAFVESVFNSKVVGLRQVSESFVNMLQGKSWNHMWYLYELLGLTIALPVLRGIANQFRDKKTENVVLITLFLFISVIPFVSKILGIEIGIKFPMNSIYAFYMLLGFSISRKKYLKIGWWGYAVIFIVICLCCADSYCHILHKDVIGFAKYSSPCIAAFATVIFMLFMNAKFKSRKVMDKIVITLSKHSFCMYIVHMLWINILYKVIKLNPIKLNFIFGIVVIYLIVSVASYMTAFILKRMPIIKKIV